MNHHAAAVLGWRRFGPYHHARADAVRDRLPLVTVELSPVDKVYAWDQVEAAAGKHRTVIDGDPDAVPARGQAGTCPIHPALASEAPFLGRSP